MLGMAEIIPLSAARRVVLEAVATQLPAERVVLAQALGRALFDDLRAVEAWPTTDRSAMDGFAVVARDGLPAGTQVVVVGQSLAGHPFAGTVAAGQAITIMTGGVVPAGADAVVPVEDKIGRASCRERV